MDPNIGKGLSIAYRIGTELVVATLIGTGLGYLLDRWLETKPWFLVAGAFLGTAGGLLNVYRIINRMMDQEKPGSESKNR